jgi:hypothetical protein
MQSAHRFGFGVLFRVGTPQTRHGSIMRISVCDSGRAEASQRPSIRLSAALHRVSRLLRAPGSKL